MTMGTYAEICNGIAAGIRSHAFLSIGHDDDTTPEQYDVRQCEWAEIALAVLSSVQESIGHPYGSANDYREFLARCGISDRVIGILNLSDDDPLAYY